MPKVLIPPPYRGPTRGEAAVVVNGSTIKECLETMEDRFPGFADLIYEDGQVADFVRFFVNDMIVNTDVLGVQLRPEDEIKILAAIAGG